MILSLIHHRVTTSDKYIHYAIKKHATKNKVIILTVYIIRGWSVQNKMQIGFLTFNVYLMQNALVDFTFKVACKLTVKVNVTCSPQKLIREGMTRGSQGFDLSFGWIADIESFQFYNT